MEERLEEKVKGSLDQSRHYRHGLIHRLTSVVKEKQLMNFIKDIMQILDLLHLLLPASFSSLDLVSC